MSKTLKNTVLSGKNTFLTEGKAGETYVIKDIINNNEEFRRFLFSLGCYKGEKISLISILGNSYIIKIKNSRYSINKKLAAIIQIEK